MGNGPPSKFSGLVQYIIFVQSLYNHKPDPKSVLGLHSHYFWHFFTHGRAIPNQSQLFKLINCVLLALSPFQPLFGNHLAFPVWVFYFLFLHLLHCSMQRGKQYTMQWEWHAWKAMWFGEQVVMIDPNYKESIFTKEIELSTICAMLILNSQ